MPTETSATSAKRRDSTPVRPVGASIDGAPLGSLLLQVIRAHRRVGVQLLNAAGVIPPQEFVLFYLAEHGQAPQTELVQYLGRDRSTVTAILQAMERAGLVRRQSAEHDRRAMTVELTPLGRRTAPAAQKAWQELERIATGSLNATQQAALIDALTAMRDALDNADPASAE